MQCQEMRKCYKGCLCLLAGIKCFAVNTKLQCTSPDQSTPDQTGPKNKNHIAQDHIRPGRTRPAQMTHDYTSTNRTRACCTKFPIRYLLSHGPNQPAVWLGPSGLKTKFQQCITSARKHLISQLNISSPTVPTNRRSGWDRRA
jgi:hypothetical protein